MRKAFFLFAMLVSVVCDMAYADIHAKAVTQFYLANAPLIAMEVNKEGVAVLQPAVAYESGKDIVVNIFTDKFVIEKSFTLKNVLDGMGYYDGLYGMWVESCDLADVVVTKNFFVKNDKWCVLICTTQNDQTGFSIPNYSVICEDGTSLGELPEMKGKSDLNIVMDHFYYGTPYLMPTSLSDEDEFQLFTFTDESSSINAVPAAAMAKAYPNPLPVGATLTVELSREADSNTVLAVLDMNGRSVLRKRIARGEDIVRIGSRFAHGHYI